VVGPGAGLVLLISALFGVTTLYYVILTLFRGWWGFGKFSIL
jgi:hypothetical protein